MNIAVLIPAYNPGERLILLVEALIQFDFLCVVVNDGSEASCRNIFARLAVMPNCHVLHHALNLGKGRALKSGFNYCCINFPDLLGIVTADADGQHPAADISKVAAEFLNHSRSLVIGVRAFAKGTPLKSLVGNIMTRHAFRFLVGGKLSDTQSGLRGIPMYIVPELIRIPGERYEYEMNMLIFSKESGIGIREVGIATVYLENNISSHFNPFIDSMKIYFQLLRFSFSSLFASSIDFIIFTVSYLLQGNILSALILARLISGSINFAVNKSLVFQSPKNIIASIVRYGILFVILGTLSFLCIKTMAGYGINVIAAKIVVESVLFLASFAIQRDFVFTAPALDRQGHKR